ncbi:MAG TPA: PAS domain-containing protein [Steroidobacter sp.]|nr:PAS domain-containing protein [Steroidobacteraceae bacterium]HLS81333.1 PAS domain-containing protein [Steroidobacter sp.]
MKSRTPPAQDDVSAEEYRRLFEAMSEGVLVQDASGRVLTCNSAGQRILGLTIEEMRGRTTAEQVEVELVHEDGTPYATHDYPSIAALRTGQPQKRMIVGVRRKDRPLVWISVDATPLISKGAERPHGVVSVFHDLSERRRAEAVLRASYDELMDLYNNAPCGYHSLDRNGVYVRVNDTELGWLGMRREDVIGKLCFADVLSPADAERFVQGFPEFVQSGDVRQEEVDLQPREGAQRHVLLHAKALRDAAGRFIYSRTTMYDITQRKAAEQDTRRLNQLLEQRVAERTAALHEAVRELEAFASSVSHDLRAPVRAVDGFARLLESEHSAQLDGQGRELLAKLIAANRRQSQLINDLLSLSRVMTSPLNRQEVDLSAVAEESYEALMQGEERPARFIVQPGMKAWADPGLMRIAFDNLLGNALKFSRDTPDRLIEVGSFTAGDGEQVYFVRDNGVGFDPARAEGLFKPFGRLHHDGDFPGSGVGLATVKRIVARHNGRIWLESSPGAGATALFTLSGPND